MIENSTSYIPNISSNTAETSNITFNKHVVIEEMVAELNRKLVHLKRKETIRVIQPYKKQEIIFSKAGKNITCVQDLFKSIAMGDLPYLVLRKQVSFEHALKGFCVYGDPQFTSCYIEASWGGIIEATGSPL
jgi:hypothetical protein